MQVVVVLPCVPPTAIDHFSRINSASISARRTTGISARARGLDLRIVLLHGGGDDDDLGAAEILARVADLDRDAERAQALDVGAVGDVGALHRVAEVVQHLGDAAHADAADADEVDGADVSGRALIMRRPPLRMVAGTRTVGVAISRRTRSASRGAASVAPLRGRRRLPASVARQVEHASGGRPTPAVKAGCGISQAPPRIARR